MPKPRKTAPARPRAALPRTVPTRARHDGWTPQRQTDFLDALAASGCVAEACAGVGLSTQSAYRLRMRPDAQGFRLAWEAALELGIRRLTDACLSRALHGEAVPHYYQGELVGEHRRYDNRLAMFLLRYRDPLRYAATLDQMVYDGHPEAAAAAYAKAHTRAADEAWDVAEGEAPFIPIPAHDRRTLTQARAAAGEAAAAAGTGPDGGDTARRARVAALRRERWEAGRAEREEAEAALADTLARLGSLPSVAPAWAPGGAAPPLDGAPAPGASPGGVDGAAPDPAAQGPAGCGVAPPPPADAPAGRGRVGGDVASPSSPSARGGGGGPGAGPSPAGRAAPDGWARGGGAPLAAAGPDPAGRTARSPGPTIRSLSP